MATFSLGSGVTPGAPGVYINEQPGLIANPAIASFDTVYMLVETEEDVPVTRFPFNKPTPVTSLNDYKVLVGGVPESRIPLLSYNCVNEFFQNAQVGDLRVVRVGTPNQIIEIEILPSGTKINSTSAPSALEAGDKVYIQMTINGMKLVSGDGSTGYTSDGEWLGVPVIMPTSFVAGDEANNRKISEAIRLAMVEAIESNPAIRSAVYVRESGMVNDKYPDLNSQNAYVSIASTTFDGNLSVVTEVVPVGTNAVLMQNAYDIENIVGGAVQLTRVPQDYTQCIDTAFDGQQDQGYLITPTAYAQFNAEGRALVGAKAAEHCENNNFKWMALADPGPYLVTDVNEYKDYVPHKAAADLITGKDYLVDNAIYEWIGSDVTYNRLTYQDLSPGQYSEVPVSESANLVADSTRVGLLDAAQYTINSLVGSASKGIFVLNDNQYWNVNLPIQKVTLTGASSILNDFANVNVQGGASNVNLNAKEIFLIAPPRNSYQSGEYSENYVYLALTALDAQNVYNAVVLAGGSVNVSTPPIGAIYVVSPTGDSALVSYVDPYWDKPVSINGQTSDLIENISGANAGVNTLHLPGTLQDPTQTYILNWVSRSIFNPSLEITSYAGTAVPAGTAVFNVVKHGLSSGQAIYFTQPIAVTNGTTTTNLVSQTTKLVSHPYYVKALTLDTFVISNSLNNYTAGNYVALPTGTITTYPTIFYSRVLGRSELSTTPVEFLTLPMLRGRKYEFDTSGIFNQAADANSVVPSTANPGAAIFYNNSASVLSPALINPYGEWITGPNLCDFTDSMILVDPTASPVASVDNAFCVPTVQQYFTSEAYLVPSIKAIEGGGYNGGLAGTIAPATGTLTIVAPGGTPTTGPGVFTNVPLGAGPGTTGTGLTATVTVANVAGTDRVTNAVVNTGGEGYQVNDALTFPAEFGGATATVATIDSATTGSIASLVSPLNDYAMQAGVKLGMSGTQLNTFIERLVGFGFWVGASGVAPDGSTPVEAGDLIYVAYDGSTYKWAVIPGEAPGVFPPAYMVNQINQVCYGSQVELTFQPEEAVPSNLWRFDAITSTEIIDNALRGVGFNGAPQAAFVEAGVDNVNRLFDDSQRYENPFGFIAYYGPYIKNGAGQWIPPSPYVTGVAARRYRSEGYQFPPAGVKYQLADANEAQIPINSAQQNLLNPKGCNAVRTLPGYPQTSIYIWGGRTRVNEASATQRLYQFINTRVILNVVYGSLRDAFDDQIFNVIDGFGVVYNQIISVGNNILNQLYVRGALFGARPSDAFQVICDSRINTPADLENGIVNAKVFVTPVPTLERIQIDLIRVAVGKMQQELDIRGLGQSNQ